MKPQRVLSSMLGIAGIGVGLEIALTMTQPVVVRAREVLAFAQGIPVIFAWTLLIVPALVFPLVRR